MSVAGLLTMTCTVRRQAGTVNDSGENSGAFSDYATLRPCRLTQGEGTELYGASVSAVIKHKLFFEYGEDIDEKDEIASVVNERGATLITSAKIERINKDPGGEANHVEVWLREVRV